MIVYEAKAEITREQSLKVNEALRTALFVKNSCLRYWIDGHVKTGYDLNKYTKVLADNPDFPWVKKLVYTSSRSSYLLAPALHNLINCSSNINPAKDINGYLH
ncbi:MULTISPECIES: hypothetical protein [unclassified Anabaena]|uniref:hypothetical protein n=1 Tax=unclassified Anabaena TaxID=2619674 RepID=UPI0039C6324B